jgi:hypothetical protein
VHTWHQYIIAVVSLWSPEAHGWRHFQRQLAQHSTLYKPVVDIYCAIKCCTVFDKNKAPKVCVKTKKERHTLQADLAHNLLGLVSRHERRRTAPWRQASTDDRETCRIRHLWNGPKLIKLFLVNTATTCLFNSKNLLHSQFDSTIQEPSSDTLHRKLLSLNIIETVLFYTQVRGGGPFWIFTRVRVHAVKRGWHKQTKRRNLRFDPISCTVRKTGLALPCCSDPFRSSQSNFGWKKRDRI